MRIYVTSILVDDQARALDFYTGKLGFVLKHDVPVGAYRWLTVVSKEQPGGTELLLEPDAHPAAAPFKAALVRDGIPSTSFQVDDIDAEFKRLKSLGVRFTMEPVDAGPVRVAILDDTCGNLIQLMQMKAAGQG
jgi:catechol 2,3-dioxygenase-like lactoylglutathione lyase family enzyme